MTKSISELDAEGINVSLYMCPRWTFRSTRTYVKRTFSMFLFFHSLALSLSFSLASLLSLSVSFYLLCLTNIWHSIAVVMNWIEVMLSSEASETNRYETMFVCRTHWTTTIRDRTDNKNRNWGESEAERTVRRVEKNHITKSERRTEWLRARAREGDSKHGQIMAMCTNPRSEEMENGDKREHL